MAIEFAEDGAMVQKCALQARTWHTRGARSEEECMRSPVDVLVDLDQTGLVLIDVWAAVDNLGWQRRMEENLPHVVELLRLFRDNGRPVFHDSTGLPMHPAALAGWASSDVLIPWDPIGGGTRVINQHMIEHNVRHVFWAGYAANICLMAKPCGFRKVLEQDWERFHFLVRDATIAHESAETLASQALLDAACYEVEYYPNGFSCTVPAVARLFSQGAAASTPRGKF